MVGYNPTELSVLLKILAANTDATIYAGGTDLMVTKKFQDVILFINDVKELKRIEKKDGYLVLGAGLTYDELLKADVPDVMKEVFEHVASPAIRNRGTIGGNICNASPAGDTLPMWYALSAQVELQKLDDHDTIIVRTIPIRDFILGIRKVDRQKGEVLTAIKVPQKVFASDVCFYYKKVGARRAEAISKLSFFGMAKCAGDKIEMVQAALGAVGITVVNPLEPLEQMIGLTKTEIIQKKTEIMNAYMAYVKPIDDQRSTAEYRKITAERLLSDFIDRIANA